MKTLKIISIILLLCIMSAFSALAEELNFEPYDARVYVDGEQIELSGKPMLFNKARWLPLAEICDYLGYAMDIDTNTVTVIPGIDCRNSDAEVDKIIFEIGAEQIVMYSGEYENKINNVYTTNDDVYSPMTYIINGEIYMSSYYMQRAFQLKIKSYSELESDTIKIYTRNYIKSAAANAKPLIAVHSDHGISIEGIRINFKSAPFLDENDRMLVPAREFCELLNKSIDWFDEPPRVAVSNIPEVPDAPDLGYAGGDSIWFTIGEMQYRINGNYYDMDTCARLIDGKTYVPLRVLGEFFGYGVAYIPVSGS